MVDPSEFLDLARTADGCGWDSIQVADAPFFPEVTSEPYPYTPDGKRFWPLDTPVLDPWVAITAMATVTKRVRFLPSVLRLAIRQPLIEAKALCSVAAVSNDRVALGVGLAWMPEEFKWLGMDKKTRGARQNEAIQVIRLLLGGGFVEFHGKYYDFDRLIMAPVPKKRIPIYVGGSSKPAILRAARYGDGWIGIVHGRDEIQGSSPSSRRSAASTAARRSPSTSCCTAPTPRPPTTSAGSKTSASPISRSRRGTCRAIQAELGVSAMRMQPPLAIKQAIARALCGRRHRHSERIEAEHVESRHDGETGFPDRRRVGVPEGPDVVARPYPQRREGRRRGVSGEPDGRAEGKGPSGLPTLLLTTTGRKSGAPRTVALVFLQDGERMVIVASLAGYDQNPAWYGNLHAQPQCQVQLDRTKMQAVAARRDGRRAEGALAAPGRDPAALGPLPEADDARLPDRDPHADGSRLIP